MAICLPRSRRSSSDTTRSDAQHLAEADSAGGRKCSSVWPAELLYNEGTMLEPPSGLARGR